MEPITFALLFAGGSVALAIWGARRRHADRVRDWRDAAERAGLRTRFRWSSFRWSLKGRSDDLFVDFRSSSGRGDEGEFTDVSIVPRQPAEREASIELRWLGGNFDAPPIPSGLESGDAALDGVAVLSGSPERLRVVLDEATRSDLLSVAREATFRYARGRAEVAIAEQQLDSYRGRYFETLLRVVRRISAPLDARAELARSAREDRLPGVRARCLAALVEGYPEAAETAATIESARADRAPAVRLVAGRALGEAGRELLAELVENREAEDPVVAAALQALGREFPVERLRAAAELAVERGRSDATRVAIDLLARSRTAEGRIAIEELLPRVWGELAEAAATALARIGSPESEPALVARLDDAPLALARQLVSALGRAGTVTSVGALRAAEARFPGEPALARAVDQAVAAIRLRTPGASEGQLSLAGGEAGALSFAGGERGALTFADPERRAAVPPGGGRG
jgi:hypothetical protein